jgi:hypothetical protein
MVSKKNGSWRMCINFTTLNKFCPKDEFPFPRIDTLVDAAAGSEMLSMLDCFSGYDQIFMKKSDEEKTSFTTPFGTYYYVRMPEGLRNAGCTFNRTIAAVLDTQLDRNISLTSTMSSCEGKNAKTTLQIFKKLSPTFVNTGSN